MSTGKGTIIVASTSAKNTPRPRQRMRENPYATTAVEAVIPMTPRIATTRLLRK